MSSWNDPELQRLFLNRTPLIDVRAPKEFLEGAIPYSMNLPIMNDEERAQVGTCYKLHGQEAAIKLGHELVSGKVKEDRIEGWRNFIRQNPEAEVFCFRGGLRSQITCQWIDMGKKPIPGGYKRLRRFFLSWLDEAPLPNLLRIGGPTGSLKTDFIKGFDHVDLEDLAHHRGSAFGNRGEQPSQVTFENKLALELLRHGGQEILIEDESAVLGKITVPRRLFQHLRSSPMIVLEIPLEERVRNIFEVYVKGNSPEFFFQSLERIRKSLGGVNYQRIREEMLDGFRTGSHDVWIASLLRDYYDPLYRRDLDRQPGSILKFGSREDLAEFLRLRRA